MLISKKIPINSLETSVRVILTDNISKAVNKLNKEGYNLTNIHISTQGLSGYSIIDDRTKFYCIIKIEQNLKETLKIMVHEMYHTTQDILENRGVRYIKGDANETYAYTIDYLFGVMYDHIVKAHNKKYKQQDK